MEFIRGRWSKSYINSFNEKHAYDDKLRTHYEFRSLFASSWCKKHVCQELTDEQIAEIDTYWAQYGIRILNHDWFKMYYAVTGIHDPRFIPDDIAGLCIYAYYNDPAYADAWRDKNMFERLLPFIPFPDILGRRVRGRFVLPDGSVLAKTEIRSFAAHLQEAAAGRPVIVKDARHSGHGRGIRKYTLKTVADAEKLLNEWNGSDNYVIQNCINQHELLASFNESSVNVIRVVTWRHEGSCDILIAGLRYGIPGSITDDSMQDGVEKINVVAVDAGGKLGRSAVNQEGCKIATIKNDLFIPSWGEIEDYVKRGSLLLDNFDVVGWDFTIDNQGHPICLEYNLEWPGTVFYQFTSGPFAGDRTDEFLSFLNDETNRANFIPHYMQLQPSPWKGVL